MNIKVIASLSLVIQFTCVRIHMHILNKINNIKINSLFFNINRNIKKSISLSIHYCSLNDMALYRIQFYAMSHV